MQKNDPSPLNRKQDPESLFPGNDCGNIACNALCKEMMSAAVAMRLDVKQAVIKAIRDHIVPQYHCIEIEEKAVRPASVCRFGFQPANNVLPFTEEAQWKVFRAGNDACPVCKELDGTLVDERLESMLPAMREKGFYRQHDGEYKPHPNCRCKWEKASMPRK